MVCKEQSPKAEQVHTGIVQPAAKFKDLPPKVKEQYPKTETLTAKFVDLRSKEILKMSAEIVTFMPREVSAPSLEDEKPKKTKDSRIVSPPSFQK